MIDKIRSINSFVATFIRNDSFFFAFTKIGAFLETFAELFIALLKAISNNSCEEGTWKNSLNGLFIIRNGVKNKCDDNSKEP